MEEDGGQSSVEAQVWFTDGNNSRSLSVQKEQCRREKKVKEDKRNGHENELS